MTFTNMKNGKPYRYTKAVIDCSSDEILTEQNHKDEADVNMIIRKHGVDLVQKTAQLQAPNMRFDDVTGNDFQEAMQIVANAQQSFEAMPSDIRKQFNNSPAEFLDFVQNPDNNDKLISMGLAEAPPEVLKPQPQEVIVIDPVTPPNPNPETPPG